MSFTYKFSYLIRNINPVIDKEYADSDIDAIITDSRTEAPSEKALFVCIKGFTFDSHTHAKKMYDRGVRYFVCESKVELPEDAVVAYCKSTRKALALISASYFGNPANFICTIALTGTKGKTSTSFMIKSILEKQGCKVGVIGTTGIYYDGKYIDSDNSTPESYLIHKYLRDMVNAECDAVVMETSSQGFKLDRTYGIEFSIGVFTNLSPDHIGPTEHDDFEEYLNCKKMLFSQCKHGIFNFDDSHFEEISKNCTCTVSTFSCSGNGDYNAYNQFFGIKNNKLITSYDYTTPKGNKTHIEFPIPGETSVYNSLCAIAVCDYLSCTAEQISDGLNSTVIRGRNETVETDKDFTVMLDYAHNEVSVNSLFTMLSHYRKGRIITVFGAGGNRSRLRRFAMGDIITQNSEIAIVTSDNPRFESLDAIIDDIMSGVKNPLGDVKIIKDRRQAIYTALSLARTDDIVLIVGKGNQDYEEIEGVKYPFDERTVVADYFKNASK